MDLRTYLSKHDGKPKPDGAECIRLARAVGRSPFFLYLAALGHKRFGPDKAAELAEQSIGGAIEPRLVNDRVEWQRAEDGRWFYRDSDRGAA